MAIVLVVLLLGTWCALSFPIAIAVGRAFRAGATAEPDPVSTHVPAA